MSINFPNNPANGNVYTYDFITYTYIRKDSQDGYWVVNTPSTLGVASSDEINEGKDNAKYLTAQGLEGSNYIKEDRVDKTTILNYDSKTRVKTTNSGVEIVGKLNLDGEIVKNGFTVPIIIATDRSSYGWYRKWSDGFIQQGGVVSVDKGRVMSFFYITPFSRNEVSLSVNADIELGDVCAMIRSKSKSAYQLSTNGGKSGSFRWMACGF